MKGFCPQVMTKLVKDDDQDRAGGLIKANVEICRKKLDTPDRTSNFDLLNNPPQLQKVFQQTTSPELGAYTDSVAKLCTGFTSVKESAAVVSKFYYYSARLNEGAKKATEENILISRLLGKELPSCPPSDILDAAQKSCKQALACPPATTLDELVKAVDADHLVYANLVDKVRKLPKDCDSRSECKSFKQAYSLAILGLTEKNPWFLNGEYTQAIRRPTKERLTKYLEESRKGLIDVEKKFEKAAQCIHGALRSDCDLDELRETLANTPEASIKNSINKDQNMASKLMDVQSCTESWSLDKNRTGKVITDFFWDAGLVVATVGLGGVSNSPKIVKAAGELGRLLGVVAEGANFSFDMYNMGVGLKDAVAACGNPESDLTKKSAKKNKCENTSLFSSSSYTHGSCLVQAAFAFVGVGTTVASANRVGKALVKDTAVVDSSTKAGSASRSVSESRSSAKAGSKSSTSVAEDMPSTSTGSASAHERGTAQIVHIADSSSVKRELVEEYAQKQLTTTAENLDWKAFVQNPRDTLRTMVRENSVLKYLNDVVIKDEEYVTALMNLSGSMEIKKYKELEEKIRKLYPNFKFHIFSDFKSVKVAYDDIPGFKMDGKSIEELLKDTANQSNKEFYEYLLKNKLVREADKPETWNKAAVDKSDDWTGLKAKYTRDHAEAGSMFLSAQKEKEFKAWAASEFASGQSLRSDILESFKDTTMVMAKGTADANLDLGVFAILRKNKDNPDVAKSLIESTYGLQPMSDANFQKLRKFFKTSDVMSPGLQGTERTFATLADAPHGGISIDMIDLGAEHIQATSAAAFGKAKDVDEFLQIARKSEQELTDQIAKRKADIEEKFRSITGDPTATVQCSGDGCKAFLPGREVTESEAKRFADAVTQNGESGKLRFSTIGKLDSREYADLMAKQGEDLEKALRKSLAKTMDVKKLKGLNFSVSINAPKPGEGTAKLHISEASGLTLSPQEKKKIQEAYKKTLEESKMGYKN